MVCADGHGRSMTVGAGAGSEVLHSPGRSPPVAAYPAARSSRSPRSCAFPAPQYTPPKPFAEAFCRLDALDEAPGERFCFPPGVVAHAGVDVRRGQSVGQAAAVAGAKAMGVMS